MVNAEAAPRAHPIGQLRRTGVTFILVTLSLALAVICDLSARPNGNYSLTLMIPVLIGMVRASPLGMRAIVVVVVATDLAITSQAPMSSATWAITVSTLVAVCFLALRVHSQWAEIRGLQRIATERADRAERHEKQLVDFIDLVNHDLRLPLEAARMQLKALRQGPLAGDTDWVQARGVDADVALGHMAAMLKDLFDIGRQEAGHLPLTPVPINLKAFLTALVDRIAVVDDRDRIEVVAPADVVVEADYHQLGRIVGNLVGNAVKYSGAGTRIIVWVAEGNDEVVLSVVDRGIGIASEDLPCIFQRGYRATEARNRADGAGLGLYAVRLFVEAHGGRIRVESTPGEGSAFHVSLPGISTGLGHGNPLTRPAFGRAGT
jgi:signal transduction histidine kinase